MPKFRKLTTKDMALGIGRKATDEELKYYFERTAKTNNRTYTLEEVSKRVKKRLPHNGKMRY